MAIWQETQHALRLSASQPRYTLLAVIVVAITVGLSIYSYSLVWRVLLKDIPFENGSRMMAVKLSKDGLIHGKKEDFNLSTLTAMKGQLTSFEMIDYVQRLDVNVSHPDGVAQHSAVYVNPTFFEFVGVSPVH